MKLVVDWKSSGEYTLFLAPYLVPILIVLTPCTSEQTVTNDI